MKSTSHAKRSFQINWSRMLEEKFEVDDLKIVECGNLMKQIFLMINFTWTRLSSFLHMLLLLYFIICLPDKMSSVRLKLFIDIQYFCLNKFN